MPGSKHRLQNHIRLTLSYGMGLSTTFTLVMPLTPHRCYTL